MLLLTTLLALAESPPDLEQEINAPPVQLDADIDRQLLWNDTTDPDHSDLVVRRYTGQLRYCYESQLKVEPTLAGLVVLDWTIEQGRVQASTAAVDTTGSDALKACLERKVLRWRFSSETTGRVVLGLTLSVDEE